MNDHHDSRATPDPRHRLQTSFANLERALARLEEFCATPVEDDRDKAGIIQAFEFTFEQYWKFFATLSQDHGLAAGSPRRALMGAFQIGVIAPEFETAWLAMLEDRNLTVHTYNQGTADDILSHIQMSYLEAMRDAHARGKAELELYPLPEP